MQNNEIIAAEKLCANKLIRKIPYRLVGLSLKAGEKFQNMTKVIKAMEISWTKEGRRPKFSQFVVKTL